MALPLRFEDSIRAFRASPDLHSLTIERSEISSHVEYIKGCASLGLPVEDLEVEPVGITLRVGICFTQKIVFRLADEVN